MSQYKFEIVGTSDKKTWDAVTDSFSCTYYHSWKYCNALEVSSSSAVFLIFGLECETDNIVSVATFSTRLFNELTIDMYTPYGYGGVISDHLNPVLFEIEFVQFLKAQRFTTFYLQQHPLHEGVKLFKKFRKSRNSVFIWDISLDTKTLWSNLSKGHKYEIKRSQKLEGFEITSDVDGTFDRFFELYIENLKRVEASEVYYFSREFLFELACHSETVYLASRIDGKVEAVTLFLNNQQSSEYFISATSNAGRNHTRILIWRTMELLKEKGIKSLNLGGGVIKGDSLAEFKSRFGANERDLEVLQIILDSENYNKQIEQHNCSEKEFFPAYWKIKRA